MKRLASIVLAASTVFASFAPASTPEEGTTTVILVRHAEKVSRRGDAELTPQGIRRASALAMELAPLKPAALYASDLQRTQETLRPLAEATGLPVNVRPYGAEPALAREILAAHRGETVVVCAHSKTLASIIAALGFGEDFPDIAGYDRLWTVTVPSVGSPVALAIRRQAFAPR